MYLWAVRVSLYGDQRGLLFSTNAWLPKPWLLVLAWRCLGACWDMSFASSLPSRRFILPDSPRHGRGLRWASYMAQQTISSQCVCCRGDIVMLTAPSSKTLSHDWSKRRYWSCHGIVHYFLDDQQSYYVPPWIVIEYCKVGVIQRRWQSWHFPVVIVWILNANKLNRLTFILIMHYMHVKLQRVMIINKIHTEHRETFFVLFWRHKHDGCVWFVSLT